jgi:deoxycytidylate deaminase
LNQVLFAISANFPVVSAVVYPARLTYIVGLNLPSMSAAEQIAPEESTQSNQKEFLDSLKILERMKTPELIIGLCGPIGSPLTDVANECKEILTLLKYEVITVKLSDFIIEHFPSLIKDSKYNHFSEDYLTAPSDKFDLKKRLIEIGNCLREKYKPTFLAECFIQQRFKERFKEEKEEPNKHLFKIDDFKDSAEDLKKVSTGKRVAFIVNSIKNQAEFDLLRSVYRELFYMVGVTSSKDSRVENLCQINGMSKSQVWELIDEETGEEIKHGQTVKDTFPQSDYFINVHPKNKDDIKLKVIRFFKLIFCHDSDSNYVPVPTPTIQETAMYMAASASWNSACLSRQVGAVLTDANGEILSIGWNDVPVAGGGLYHHDKEKSSKITKDLFYNPKYKDERCFNWRFCSNDNQKNNIAKIIAEDLKQGGVLKDDQAIIKKTEEIIHSSKIRSLVEFSRSIHAEMHAIISGCISAGDRVRNGKLYITTYPCHICARHIVLAGIKEVYYIEPYKKSMTTTLHGDSITDEEDLKVDDQHKVWIRQFEGVGPNRYMNLFKMIPNSRKKKSTGQMFENQKDPADIAPKYSISLTAVPTIESKIIGALKSKLENI